jgi:hypothetical protein
LNDPKSKFGRLAEKAAKPSSESKELSLGDRLTKFHTRKEISNRFGDAATPVEKPEPIVVPTVKATRIGSTNLDPQTEQLRQAAAASRQNVKDRKTRLSRIDNLMANLSEEDADAILQGFAKKHPDFYPSPFNVSQLMQVFYACYDQGAQGVTAFNISSLDAVYAWMVQQQPPLFEKARKLRGEPAVGPYFYTPEVHEEKMASRTVQRTVVTAEEQARLKSMNFEELKKEATAGYKPAKGRTV